MNEKKRWLCDYDPEMEIDEVYKDIKRILDGDVDNPLYREYERFDKTNESRNRHKYLDAIVYSIIKKYEHKNAGNCGKKFINIIPRANRQSDSSSMLQTNFRVIFGASFSISDNVITLQQYRDQLARYDGYSSQEHKKNLLIVLSDNEKPLFNLENLEDKKVDLVELLKSNRQLVLNGAPGTGKTYKARNEIANQLLFGKDKGTDLSDEEIKQKEFRMGFVQFHPSYDYTDFIEGIRPKLSSDNDEISYTLKNGIFKDFCIKAGVLERIRKVEKGKQRITTEEIGRYLHIDGNEMETDCYYEFWKDWNEKHPDQDSNYPPFLFIIDEINRAEISKVLGEIMFCLDPDYRGEGIKTQYAASATEDSFFLNSKDDKFFIPSNVYIVATMNDIDRSVEVFDFALRRRFAWYEIKASHDEIESVLREMKVDAILGKFFDSYVKKANTVNDNIIDKLNLSEQYKLGPSYFAKIVNFFKGMESDDCFKDALSFVWNNHIYQILSEYIKGRKILEEIVGEMGKSFKELQD